MFFILFFFDWNVLKEFGVCFRIMMVYVCKYLFFRNIGVGVVDWILVCGMSKYYLFEYEFLNYCEMLFFNRYSKLYLSNKI